MKPWEEKWFVVGKPTLHGWRYGVYWKDTNRIVSYRLYSNPTDARRGATMRWRYMLKKIEKELLE